MGNRVPLGAPVAAHGVSFRAARPQDPIREGRMEPTVEKVVAFVAWLVANWAYLDFCRMGEGGFKRLAAFWIGFPTTFVTRLVVDEGTQPRMREDDDDLDELVREVRRDRRLREGGGPGERA